MAIVSLRGVLAVLGAVLALAVSPFACAQSSPSMGGLLFQNYCNPGPFDTTSNDAKTRYPIVLVSGVTGTAPNFLLPGVEYWYGIPEALCRAGATVYVAAMPAVNTDYVRGPILVSQIQALLATLGVQKVNLIAHSQGGVTARYAAAAIPQNIASVTTISTPHKGVALADVLISNPLSDTVAFAAFSAAGLIGNAVNDSSYPVRAQALLNQASRAGMAQFNSQFPSAGLSTAQCVGANDDTGTRQTVDVRQGPDGQTVTQPLYSWSGNAPIPFLSPDAVGDTLMVAIQPFVQAGNEGANDGVVGVCSSRFGQVLGTYGWNHLTEINQLLGLVPPIGPNPVQVIVNHANRLKNQGL